MRPDPPELQPLREVKVFDVLGESADRRLEASGVLARDGLLYVIFDNVPHIACVDASLSPRARANHLIPQPRGRRSGFEDIAHDRWSGSFYVLIEAVPVRGGYMARVQEYDGDLRFRSGCFLDFPLDRENKGLEGLTCVRRGGETYLLALCEGNLCEGGARGRKPGRGRIQIFRRGRRRWEHVGCIRLPETLRFADYSSIAAADGRIAVVSQVSSALWVGRLSTERWEVAAPGIVYAFPRDPGGKIMYCTIEGVSWMQPEQVVVVSDKAKPTESRRCQAKDQSIHVFRIPTGPASQTAM